jgi:hypothetical protein
MRADAEALSEYGVVPEYFTLFISRCIPSFSSQCFLVELVSDSDVTFQRAEFRL